MDQILHVTYSKQKHLFTIFYLRARARAGERSLGESESTRFLSECYCTLAPRALDAHALSSSSSRSNSTDMRDRSFCSACTSARFGSSAAEEADGPPVTPR